MDVTVRTSVVMLNVVFVKTAGYDKILIGVLVWKTSVGIDVNFFIAYADNDRFGASFSFASMIVIDNYKIRILAFYISI
jgi:hypothetical protein